MPLHMHGNYKIPGLTPICCSSLAIKVHVTISHNHGHWQIPLISKRTTNLWELTPCALIMSKPQLLKISTLCDQLNDLQLENICTTSFEF